MWRERPSQIIRIVAENYDCSTAATEDAGSLSGCCSARGPGRGMLAPGRAAATDDQLVVNPDTGLAISGFDPVAYFTDGKPAIWAPGTRIATWTAWSGASATKATAAAFADASEVYTPRFGGYDPVGDRARPLGAGSSADLGGGRRAALSLLQRADARGLSRRSGPRHRRRRAQVAGRSRARIGTLS